MKHKNGREIMHTYGCKDLPTIEEEAQYPSCKTFKDNLCVCGRHVIYQ